MAKPNELDGKRIKLVLIEDDYTDLKPGDMGTVDFVDDIGNIHMKWDNGGTLALIPEIDLFEIIAESNAMKPNVNKDRNKLMLFESFSLQNSMDILERGIVGIKRIVKSATFIGVEYVSEDTNYTARLDVSFIDGNNTQGIIYEIDLSDNMVIKIPYIVSDIDEDDENVEPIESYFQSVGKIVEYLTTEIQDFIRVEESNRYKNKNKKRV